MNLKKCLRSKLGQTVVEYALLVAVAIATLLLSGFFAGSMRDALNDHFDKARSRIQVY